MLLVFTRKNGDFPWRFEFHRSVFSPGTCEVSSLVRGPELDEIVHDFLGAPLGRLVTMAFSTLRTGPGFLKLNPLLG